MFQLRLILSLIIVFLIKIKNVQLNKNEIFQEDLSNHMKIGLSEKGYKSVQLKCGSDSMLIELETEDDFYGVIYTRGSYHDKTSPCFIDPGNKRGQRSFSMKFPLNDCKTKQIGEVYSNVLVLQHDKDLIMPGDAAFNLECDFNRPRDFTVNANLHNEGKPVISRISLRDADPAVKESNTRSKRSVESQTNTVILTPEFFKQRKEEL